LFKLSQKGEAYDIEPIVFKKPAKTEEQKLKDAEKKLAKEQERQLRKAEIEKERLLRKAIREQERERKRQDTELLVWTSRECSISRTVLTIELRKKRTRNFRWCSSTTDTRITSTSSLIRTSRSIRLMHS
jgi:hypothetical protein